VNFDPPRYGVDFNVDSGWVGVGVGIDEGEDDGVDDELKKWKKSVL
jgi:hypothetical protein